MATQRCKCWMLSSRHQECVCSVGDVVRYRSHVSGPNRIDVHLEVSPVPFEELSARRAAESSAAIRRRVLLARRVQARRFSGCHLVHCDAQMSMRMVRQSRTSASASAPAPRAHPQCRGQIADLAASDVRPEHRAEAIQYRSIERRLEGTRFGFESIARTAYLTPPFIAAPN